MTERENDLERQTGKSTGEIEPSADGGGVAPADEESWSLFGWSKYLADSDATESAPSEDSAEPDSFAFKPALDQPVGQAEKERDFAIAGAEETVAPAVLDSEPEKNLEENTEIKPLPYWEDENTSLESSNEVAPQYTESPEVEAQINEPGDQTPGAISIQNLGKSLLGINLFASDAVLEENENSEGEGDSQANADQALPDMKAAEADGQKIEHAIEESPLPNFSQVQATALPDFEPAEPPADAQVEMLGYHADLPDRDYSELPESKSDNSRNNDADEAEPPAPWLKLTLSGSSSHSPSDRPASEAGEDLGQTADQFEPSSPIVEVPGPKEAELEGEAVPGAASVDWDWQPQVQTDTWDIGSAGDAPEEDPGIKPEKTRPPMVEVDFSMTMPRKASDSDQGQIPKEAPLPSEMTIKYKRKLKPVFQVNEAGIAQAPATPPEPEEENVDPIEERHPVDPIEERRPVVEENAYFVSAALPEPSESWDQKTDTFSVGKDYPLEGVKTGFQQNESSEHEYDASLSTQARSFQAHFDPEPQINEDIDQAVRKAHKLYFDGRFESACKHYSLIVQRLENHPDENNALLGECLKMLADLHILLDEPKTAVDLLERVKGIPGIPPVKPEKYLSALLKLAAKYESQGQPSEGIYWQAIELAADELQEGDPMHQRINDAYVQMSKRKLERNQVFKPADAQSLVSKTMPDKAILPKRKTVDVGELTVELEKSKGFAVDVSITKAVEEISQAPFVRVLNSLPVQLILSLLLFACGACIFVVLKPFERTALPPISIKMAERYQTADGLKVLEFKNKETISIFQEGIVEVGQYKIMRGTIEDLFDVLRRHMRTRTIFCRINDENSEEAEPYLTDEDGRSLYSQEAPEMKVVKQMWWYSGFAQWHYKEKHCYPGKVEPWDKVAPGFVYVNPIAGKPVSCTITASSGAASKLIPSMMGAGHIFEKEPVGRPGGINCVVFDKVRFFVRGFDRTGQLICGNTPGKAFYIECTDGINLTQAYLKTFGDKPPKPGDQSPLRVIVVPSGKDLPDHFHLLRGSIGSFSWAFFVISMLVSSIAFIGKRLRWYHYLSLLTSICILLAWYGYCLGWN